jgi:hypothetical protein
MAENQKNNMLWHGKAQLMMLDRRREQHKVRQWSLRKVPRRWRGLNMKRRLQ